MLDHFLHYNILFVRKGKFSPFLFLVILITILSCNRANHTSLNFKKHELVSYNTGFTASGYHWGTIKVSKDTLIYFADVLTKKKITLFSLTGKKIKTIPLDTVLKKYLKIDDICVKSLDSVIVLARYANQIYFINGTGNITKHIDLDPYLYINGYKFEVYSTVLPNSDFCLNNDFIFAMGLAKFSSEDTTRQKYLYDFFKTKYHLNYFIKFSNLSDSIHTKTGFNQLYASFKPNKFIVEGSYFKFVNNRIFVLTGYKDTIYELDTNFNVLAKHKILSDYTDLDLGKNIVDIQDIDNDPNYPNILAQTCGRIDKFYYDAFRKRYYVTVSHKVNIKNKRKDRAENRPWSLLVYDNKFNKLGEFVFNGKEYYDSFIILKNGIFIKISKYNKLYERDKAQFRRFTIE